MTAFIFVTQKAGPRGELEGLFAGRPWVEECHRVAGEESLLLKVRAESMPALEHLVWEIRALDSVERTKTMIVLGDGLRGPPGGAGHARVADRPRRYRQAASSASGSRP